MIVLYRILCSCISLSFPCHTAVIGIGERLGGGEEEELLLIVNICLCSCIWALSGDWRWRPGLGGACPRLHIRRAWDGGGGEWGDLLTSSWGSTTGTHLKIRREVSPTVTQRFSLWDSGGLGQRGLRGGPPRGRDTSGDTPRYGGDALMEGHFC